MSALPQVTREVDRGQVGAQDVELRGEGPEGPAAVADGVLLVRGHLGERAAVALGGHEDRVVAEPASRHSLRRR